MAHPHLVLVTSGTGKTGRRVVERLQARDIPVRVGSRAGSPPFDWTDRSTWAAALHGAHAVYMVYQPDLAVPGAPDDIRAFTAQAIALGVRRMVLLSGRGEPEAQVCEQIVQRSGAEWVMVRASWFNQNFDEGYLLPAIVSGGVALPVDAMREPFIDADDIADVVTAALTEDRHAGQIYEVTGPRLMTFQEAVRVIARASGRTLAWTTLTPQQYSDGLRAVGVPEADIALMHYLFTDLMDGRNATLGDGVQRALGRAPRDFSAYAQAAAVSGVWNGAAEQV